MKMGNNTVKALQTKAEKLFPHKKYPPKVTMFLAENRDINYSCEVYILQYCPSPQSTEPLRFFLGTQNEDVLGVLEQLSLDTKSKDVTYSHPLDLNSLYSLHEFLVNNHFAMEFEKKWISLENKEELYQEMIEDNIETRFKKDFQLHSYPTSFFLTVWRNDTIQCNLRVYLPDTRVVGLDWKVFVRCCSETFMSTLESRLQELFTFLQNQIEKKN